MSSPRKIALFGGTFDPVHLGHVHLAREAVRQFGLDEVRFLPCRISPHKLYNTPSPVADRLEMLRLATAELPWAVVDDYEARRDGPSFSWKTAEAMAERFPQARRFWIMGGDQWATLDTWAEPQRLAGHVEFIVCARGAAPDPREGFRFHPLRVDHPASATAIRKAIASGVSAHGWLDPAVNRWIRERRLYSNGA